MEASKMITFKNLPATDLQHAIDIELASYPADEAASLQSLTYRQKNAGNAFIATSNDDKKETSSNTTTPSVEEDEDDECPICLEVLPKNDLKFTRMPCCGKGMHYKCGKKQSER